MRVHVDDDRCQGHTLCNMCAPEVFHLRDDDGHAYVLSEKVTPGLEDAVRRAAQNCPEQAIVISD